MSIRPRRSALYMPGSNARALEKAKTLPADALILDLEDAVAPDAKELARQQVIDAVRGGGYGQRELVIRINAMDTQWGRADLEAAATSGADAVCIPKVETAEQVQSVARIMEAAGAPQEMAIWVMAETPLGVLNAAAVCSAHRRVAVMVMGTSDLSKELRVPHTPSRLGFLTSLGHCLLAARAANLDILDGVYLDLEDSEGLSGACQQGRELGFDGKTLIHPKQIEPANAAFAPSPAERERAEKILAAWQQASAEGQGVVVVDGKLVESLHVDEAHRVLEIAEAISAR